MAKKVFILNKPFEGSYTDEEGNVAHEIINYFKTDNGGIFIYNNPNGQCPKNINHDESQEYQVEYMFFARRAKISEKGEPASSDFDLTHMVKIEEVLHHESSHKNEEDLKKSHKVVKKKIEDHYIYYGGKPIDEIYDDNDESMYVTFKASKVWKAKKPIKVTTPGYRFQRNKGYVYSDGETQEAYAALENVICNENWEDITNKMPQVNINNYHGVTRKTFMDLIMKVESEECYTNMLYYVLDFKDTLIKFLNEFVNNAFISSNKFKIKREYTVSKTDDSPGGRMDICAFNDEQRIVIENKVFSGLNGIDEKSNKSQLSTYYAWAKDKTTRDPICIITCPDFRVNEIKNEIEPEIKGKYLFVTYSQISEFLLKLAKGCHFEGHIYERYVEDIAYSFNKFGYKDKSELFEQYFLESIIQSNNK